MEKITSKSEGTWALRRLGYIIAIVIMFVILYIMVRLYEWGIPFITEEYNGLIWYFRLSIYASVGAHILFLIYDPKWFRHLLRGVTNIISTLVVIMFYVVYPFDFPGSFQRIGKIILLVLIILSIIGIITEFVKAIKHMAKNN